MLNKPFSSFNTDGLGDPSRFRERWRNALRDPAWLALMATALAVCGWMLWRLWASQ